MENLHKSEVAALAVLLQIIREKNDVILSWIIFDKL